MESKSIKGSEHNEAETVCIRVNKIYDWVTRQVDVPLIVIQSGDIKNGCYSFVRLDTGDPVDPCSFRGNLTVKCYLSDANGNPVTLDEIDCREIPQPGGVREEMTILVDCNPIKLQKVKVAKQGFVTVQITNGMETAILTPAVPWHVAEKFFLCAPAGTSLLCDVTDFECDALLVCSTDPYGASNFSQLKISINMCQDIQIESSIKVEVEACPCAPRPEISVTCPPAQFPAQCPDIFPKSY